MSNYNQSPDAMQPSFLSQVAEGMQGTMQFASNAVSGAYQSMATGAHMGMMSIQSAHSQIAQYQQMYEQTRQGYMGDMHLLSEQTKVAASQFYDPARNMGGQIVHGAAYAAATATGWTMMGRLPMFSAGRLLGKGAAAAMGFGTKGLVAGGLGLAGGLTGMMAPFMAIDHIVEGVMENAAQREEFAGAMGRFSQIGSNPLYRVGNASAFNRAERLGVARDIQNFTFDLDKQDLGQFKMGMEGTSQVLNAFGAQMFRDPQLSPEKFQDMFKSRIKMVREFAIAFDKTIEESIGLIRQLQGMTGDHQGGTNPTRVAALIGQAGNISGLGSNAIMQIAHGVGQNFLASGLTSGQGVLTATRLIGDIGTMRNGMLISNNDFMRVGGIGGAATQLGQFSAGFTSGDFGQVFAAAAMRNGAVDQNVLNQIASGKINLTQAISSGAGNIGGGGVNALSDFYAKKDIYTQSITPLQQQGMIAQSAVQMLQMTGMNINQTNLSTVFQSQFGMSAPMSRIMAGNIMNPEIYEQQQRAAINVANARINENEIAQNSLGSYLYRKTGAEWVGNRISSGLYGLYRSGGDLVSGAASWVGEGYRNISDSMTGNIRLNMRGAGDYRAIIGDLSAAPIEPSKIEFSNDTIRRNHNQINAAVTNLGGSNITGVSTQGTRGGGYINLGFMNGTSATMSRDAIKRSGHTQAELRVLGGMMGTGVANVSNVYEAYSTAENMTDEEADSAKNLLLRQNAFFSDAYSGTRMDVDSIYKSGAVNNGFLAVAAALAGKKKVTVDELVGVIRQKGAEKAFGFSKGESLIAAKSKANAKAIGMLVSFSGTTLDARDDARFNINEMSAKTAEEKLASAKKSMNDFFGSSKNLLGELATSLEYSDETQDDYEHNLRLIGSAYGGYSAEEALRSGGDGLKKTVMRAASAMARYGDNTKKDRTKATDAVLRDVMQEHRKATGTQRGYLGSLLQDLVTFREEGVSKFTDALTKAGVVDRMGFADRIDRILATLNQSESINARTKTFIQFGHQTARELGAINQEDAAKAALSNGGKDTGAAVKTLFSMFKDYAKDGRPEEGLLAIGKKYNDDSNFKKAAQALNVMGGTTGRFSEMVVQLGFIQNKTGYDFFKGAGSDPVYSKLYDKAFLEKVYSTDKKVSGAALQEIEVSLSKNKDYKADLETLRGSVGWEKKTASQKAATILALGRSNARGDQSIMLATMAADKTGVVNGEINVAGTSAGAQSKVNERVLTVLNEQFRALETHRVLMETLHNQIRATAK